MAKSSGRHSVAAQRARYAQPPDDEEKYAYLRLRQHRWVFWAQGLAFVGVGISLYGMAQNAAWTLPFLLPLAILGLEQILAARTSTFRRRVTLPDHLFRVETYSPASYPSIDVFLPTAGEPLAMLRNTYKHVQLLDWAGPLATYVLDDMGRVEVADLASEFGFAYIARPNRALKKAGNLQYGLERSGGEFVTILDADFVPRPDYLTELMPYMSDRKLGIVQSPQYFKTDKGMTWLERCAGATQELFYRFIQPSRDAVGAAICVGTSAVYRRVALETIGGFPQIGHSEDVYTGVEMNRAGFKVQYVPVLVSRGTSPADLNSFISQQYRWAEGSLSLAFDRAFHGDTSMSLLQRLSFWSGFLYYITTAMNAILAPMAILVMVWFFPERIVSVDVLPLLGAIACWLFVLPMVSHGRWRVEVLRVQAIYSFAHLFCLIDIFRGRVSEWVVTNTGTRKQPLARRVRRAMAIYIGVTQVAVVTGLIVGTERFGLGRYWGNIALAILSAYVLVPVAMLSARATRRRDSPSVLIDLRDETIAPQRLINLRGPLGVRETEVEA